MISMNLAYLVPLKGKLALHFPHDCTGLAHWAYKERVEPDLVILSPRQLRDHEIIRLIELIHDVRFVRASSSAMSQRSIIFIWSTFILGRLYYLLQFYGLLSIINAQGRFSEIWTGLYLLLFLPLFSSVVQALARGHIAETVAGYRNLYHSIHPDNVKVEVHAGLAVLRETINNAPPERAYVEALHVARRWALDELVPLYRRAAQAGRWTVRLPCPYGWLEDYESHVG